jgi:hypothetical protein
MTGGKHRLTGAVRVPLPPDEAFVLFTPRGEEQWVTGWQPRFPAPAADDTEPGTVFETAAHGEVTTWVVLDREPGCQISYARVTPGSRAGTVAVRLDADGAGRSIVNVTYTLTALSAAGGRELAEFAAAYPAFLASWEEAITAFLAAGRDGRTAQPASS